MFLYFLIICLILFAGAILTVAGLLNNNHRHVIKPTLIVCLITVGTVIIPLFFSSVLEVLKGKPSRKELVGEYEIVEVKNLNIDKSCYSIYKLTFKGDSTFALTPTPYIHVCKNGKYNLDYSNEYNEITFQCGLGFTTGHVDAHVGNFRIEFMIGDPDSGQSIYFGKKASKR